MLLVGRRRGINDEGVRVEEEEEERKESGSRLLLERLVRTWFGTRGRGIRLEVIGVEEEQEGGGVDKGGREVPSVKLRSSTTSLLPTTPRGGAPLDPSMEQEGGGRAALEEVDRDRGVAGFRLGRIRTTEMGGTEEREES